MTDKIFISANQLLEDSFALGKKILQKDFVPDLIIGIWRGGAPVAIAVHELLAYAGLDIDHIPVRTSLYTGLDERANSVTITGLDYVTKGNPRFSRLLLVDDVFDSGTTMTAIVDTLTSQLTDNTDLDIRTATVWYKPERNKSQLTPDYFVHTTDSWLVFPHELCGIDKAELLANKPGITDVIEQVPGS